MANAFDEFDSEQGPNPFDEFDAPAVATANPFDEFDNIEGGESYSIPKEQRAAPTLRQPVPPISTLGEQPRPPESLQTPAVGMQDFGVPPVQTPTDRLGLVPTQAMMA